MLISFGSDRSKDVFTFLLHVLCHVRVAREYPFRTLQTTKFGRMLMY